MGLYFFLVAVNISLLGAAGSLLVFHSCLFMLADEMLMRVRVLYDLLLVICVMNGVFLAEKPNCARESIKYSPLFIILHFIVVLLFWLANFAEGGYSDPFSGVGVLDGDSLVLV